MEKFVPIVILCAGSLLQAAPVAASAPAPAAAAPSAEQIAPGVHLLRGAILRDPGPDGLAQRCDPRIRLRARPADRRHRQYALASRSLERQWPAEGGVRREEIEIFIATMEEQDQLHPDVVVERSGELKLAGKTSTCASPIVP